MRRGEEVDDDGGFGGDEVEGVDEEFGMGCVESGLGWEEGERGGGVGAEVRGEEVEVEELLVEDR